jgi:hypothetical protein
MSAKHNEKKCSLCGAEVINTAEEDGHASFRVEAGRDPRGCAIPAAPSTDVGQCWIDATCPCCGSPSLMSKES